MRLINRWLYLVLLKKLMKKRKEYLNYKKSWKTQRLSMIIKNQVVLVMLKILKALFLGEYHQGFGCLESILIL